MTVLVTGGAGFVGANLSVWLSQAGHRVTAMDNLVRRGSELNLERLAAAGVTFHHGDIRCPEDFPKGPFQGICETSAQPSATAGLTNPVFDITNNLTGLVNCLELCRNHGSALVFWSTNKVYSADAINRIPVEEGELRWESQGGPAPQSIADWLSWSYPHTGERVATVSRLCPIGGGNQSIYGATKAAAELLIAEYRTAFGVTAHINRFSCLAGPYQWGMASQGWVAWFILAKHLGLPVTLYGWEGKQVRDVLHIKDVCVLVERQLVNGMSSGPYNVGGGVDNLLSPLELCQILGLKYTLHDRARYADHRYYVSDIGGVCVDFDWYPKRPVSQVLHETERWVTDNLETIRKVVQ